jgi:hypothetical protein
MFPLFFIDNSKIENLKKEAHLESLFMDVVTEAKSLVGAESTCLYLRVTKDDNRKSEKHNHLPFCPAADGEFLYAMYYVLPHHQRVSAQVGHQKLTINENSSSRFLRLGKGIVSRAVMTGMAWNIVDVSSEPDFSPEIREEDGMAKELKYLRHMVVVPVFDYQGRAIGVIRAMNKVEGEGSQKGFTHMDVQILKALASHISVSLNSVYQDQIEEVRLRDTIQILREQGIQRTEKDIPDSSNLFPDE